MRFVLSDESVNRYGFRVLTSGINLEAFKANPVMFYNHNRYDMPIGIWKNIKIEGDTLTAEPEFDEDDELAKRVQAKVEKGHLRMCSIGFDVLELSDDPALMLAGQKRSTVTKCDLMEVSIADIGANKAALKLKFKNGLTLSGLSGAIDDTYLNSVLPIIQPSNMSKETAKKLGLPETATQAEIDAKIESLQATAQGSTNQLQAGQTTAAPTVATHSNDDLVESVLKVGEDKGVVNANNREDYKAMVKANPSAALKAFNGTATPEKADSTVRLTEVLEQLKSGQSGQQPIKDERASWNLTQWSQKDPKGLKEMMRNKPADYKKLFAAEYGVEPTDQDIRTLL